MAHVSIEHTLMFMLMFILTTAGLFLSLKAKKMVTGYRAEFLSSTILSFFVFSAAITFHLLREHILHIEDFVLLEHSFILLSFICILCTGIRAMRHKEEWGIM